MNTAALLFSPEWLGRCMPLPAMPPRGWVPFPSASNGTLRGTGSGSRRRCRSRRNQRSRTGCSSCATRCRGSRDGSQPRLPGGRPECSWEQGAEEEGEEEEEEVVVTAVMHPLGWVALPCFVFTDEREGGTCLVIGKDEFYGKSLVNRLRFGAICFPFFTR